MLEIYVPRYKKIDSGFIKTYKLGPRLGDSAEITMMELVKPKLEKEIEGNNGKSETTTKKTDEVKPVKKVSSKSKTSK